jgi:hypothetical protein
VRNCQRQWHRNARTEPGALSVLQAVNATPELGELHVRIFEDMARRLAAAMRTRGLRRSTDQLLAIGRTWVVAQNFGMETYLRLRGPAARRFLEELALSQERYLEPYLDAPTPRRRR